MNSSKEVTNVVLVHGAWADGSSWNRIIPALQERGLRVLAAPIPLTSLQDDLMAVERTMKRTEGPIILVAHAYSGAVISASINDRISSLVFVAALAPDEGETVAEVFYRDEPHPDAPHLEPDSDGLIWMPDESFRKAFSQNTSEAEASLLAAVQRPIALKCIKESSPKPLWKVKPSWYLVAKDDRMINPATQYFMAERMGAQISSEGVDHLPLVTAPIAVLDVILQAVATSSATD
jgi:pimeloyl-ACP methyl ester carboxylesterase